MTTEVDPTSAADGGETGDNGTSVKTVPESDLIAVKQSLETKVSESESKLAEATAALEQERAGHKPVEEKAQQVDVLTVERDNLQTQLDTKTAEHQTLLDTSLTEVRKRLVEEYHLPQDKVDGFSLEQARLFLDTLPAPTNITPANYDLNGGGQGGDVSSLTAREKIRQGL